MNKFKQVLDIRRGKASDPKMNALVALDSDITENRGRASQEKVDSFFAYGYSKENLVDLILQVSDKTAMNYLHNLTSVPVDFPLAPSLELKVAQSLN